MLETISIIFESIIFYKRKQAKKESVTANPSLSSAAKRVVTFYDLDTHLAIVWGVISGRCWILS